MTRLTLQSPAAQTPTVLIVDDNAEFRTTLAALARGEHYRVEEAATGSEALDKLRWGLQPQAIILDMQMRVMTGWEFRAEQLRDPRLAAIPVIAMTAGPWKGQDNDAFTYRLQKPLDLAQLWRYLHQYR
jgi:CheY-like chemotaxis protein